jgi:CheY-like chemotaxis protein
MYVKMTKRKILIIDDDPSIVDVLSIILDSEGYTAYTKDGKKMSEIIKLNPDVILLDMMLSGVDGRDLCRRLKKNPKTCEIPVIMISAHHDAKSQSLLAGADAFISKPFDIEDIKKGVETLISKL